MDRPLRNIDRIRRDDAKRRELLATESATNRPPLATPIDSSQPPVATSGKLESVASTVATLISTAQGSNGPQLAPAVASRQRAKKVFTPAHKSQFNIRIPKPLKAKLDLLAAACGKTLNELAEEAFSLLLATPDGRLLAAYDSEDDLNDPIIKLFVKSTGKSFSGKDREAYNQVRHLDPNVIRLGMLLTLVQTGEARINSFSYFIPEIQKAAQTITSLPSPLDYITYLESKVRKKYGREGKRPQP